MALEIKAVPTEDACSDFKRQNLGRCKALQWLKQWRRNLPFWRGITYVHLFSIWMVSYLRQPAVKHNRWAPPDNISKVCCLHLMYFWQTSVQGLSKVLPKTLCLLKLLHQQYKRTLFILSKFKTMKKLWDKKGWCSHQSWISFIAQKERYILEMKVWLYRWC